MAVVCGKLSNYLEYIIFNHFRLSFFRKMYQNLIAQNILCPKFTTSEFIKIRILDQIMAKILSDTTKIRLVRKFTIRNLTVRCFCL